ncbi:hypothetical protein [[Eubacterium] cellulosolvens]
MAHKIPKDEDVLTAIQRVILRYAAINSQKQLKKLVQQELSGLDPKYHVSAPRVRGLALKSKFIHCEIKYRVWPDHKTKLKRCPVCDSTVQRIRNKTLANEIVTIGYKCGNCPYSTDLPIKIPARYIFSARRV